VDEVVVVGRVDLQPVPWYLVEHVLAEVWENPTDVHDIEVPLEEAEIDEVVYSRIAIGIVLGEDIILFFTSKLQK
jgi:hypothetical protein